MNSPSPLEYDEACALVAELEAYQQWFTCMELYEEAYDHLKTTEANTMEFLKQIIMYTKEEIAQHLYNVYKARKAEEQARAQVEDAFEYMLEHKEAQDMMMLAHMQGKHPHEFFN